MAPLGPFGPTPTILAGVSGGPHSLALALLLARWVLARGGRLLAGIVDHGLRAESAKEAADVAGWLVARGIESRILRLGLAPGPGAQARARAGRLAALLDLATTEGAGWLALGQHRADQAETLLLRGLAGSGAAGLAGMAAARSAGAALLIRPLLGQAPARLEAVVAAAGLAPLRDPSNADPRFTRARLRAALADAAGQGPAVAALDQAARAFAARRARQAQVVAARLAVAVQLSEWGFGRLDLAALGRDEVAEAALAGLVRMVGGGAYAPSEAAVGRLLAQGAGTLGGARLTRQGLLLREAAAMAPAVPAVPGALWDGRFRLEGQPPLGLWLGPLGPAAASLPRPAWLPAAVAATLPALWRADRASRDTVLAEVPALAYSDFQTSFDIRLRFAPLGGAGG
ncbi:tRNA lysidine(34) synthetase TilS [Falsiroseomonas tokyonensis]|uniref:tRNA(Ile)-lysidine synthase n=1 Tax=Falsiroseomonas tokyonensis TaxID=430521 RepID=A0ABV7C0H8_9PROT|nr:tRNA lysidine(34) synthetase TilS [Falsiroseomonas tokyonensis]MBU8541402.1 tRNA lysidine(34) synthetase TilS [Falsiroseomonas tokyonensis]